MAAKKTNMVGKRYSSSYGWCTIIEYIDTNRITVQFDGLGSFITNCTFYNLKTGKVKNYYYPSVCGIGYIGDKNIEPPFVNGKITHCYDVWHNMITRCYDAKFVSQNLLYEDCSVDTEWHNFQNFAKWWKSEVLSDFKDSRGRSSAIDKNLMSKERRGNLYSEQTCTLLPEEIKIALITGDFRKYDLPSGVFSKGNCFSARISKYNKSIYIGSFSTPEEASLAYQQEKRNYIKELAKKYESVLTSRVFNRLMEWK